MARRHAGKWDRSGPQHPLCPPWPNFSLPGDVAASRRYYDPDLIDPPIEVGSRRHDTGADGARHRRERRGGAGRAYDAAQHEFHSMTNAIRPGPCLAVSRRDWRGVADRGLRDCTTGPATGAHERAKAGRPSSSWSTNGFSRRRMERSWKGPCRRRASGRRRRCPAWETCFTTSDDRVRRRAAIAIGRVGSVAGVAWLVPALEDPHPSVRQMVAFALGLIGGVEATEPLLRALTDPDPITSGWAAMGLATAGRRSGCSSDRRHGRHPRGCGRLTSNRMISRTRRRPRRRRFEWV